MPPQTVGQCKRNECLVMELSAGPLSAALGMLQPQSEAKAHVKRETVICLWKDR